MNEIQHMGGVRIDNLCRIIAGELRSGPHSHPQAAQKEIDRLRNAPLRAEVRKGKENQWFAAIEDHEGTPLLYSDELGSQGAARTAGQAALRLIKG
jgi:hypothetical protein